MTVIFCRLSSVVLCRRLTLLFSKVFPLPVTPHGQEASQDSSENAARAGPT